MSVYRAKPGIGDLSIYLRCLPNHYHFNSIEYYSTILSYVTYKRIWLFLAPAVSVYTVFMCRDVIYLLCHIYVNLLMCICSALSPDCLEVIIMTVCRVRKGIWLK